MRNMLISLFSLVVLAGCNSTPPPPIQYPPLDPDDTLEWEPKDCNPEGVPRECTDKVGFFTDRHGYYYVMEAPICSSVLLLEEHPKGETLTHLYQNPHRHAIIGNGKMRTATLSCVQYPLHHQLSRRQRPEGKDAVTGLSLPLPQDKTPQDPTLTLKAQSPLGPNSTVKNWNKPNITDNPLDSKE